MSSTSNPFETLVVHVKSHKMNAFMKVLAETVEYKSESNQPMEPWLDPEDKNYLLWPLVVFLPNTDVVAADQLFGETLLRTQIYSELGTDEITVPYGGIVNVVVPCFFKPLQKDVNLKFTVTEENVEHVVENASNMRSLTPQEDVEL